MTRRTTLRLFALALVAAAVALTAGPVAAASDPTPAVAAAPVFGYWSEFLDHWLGALKRQNGIIVVALGVGAVALLIITRGKWQK